MKQLYYALWETKHHGLYRHIHVCESEYEPIADRIAWHESGRAYIDPESETGKRTLADLRSLAARGYTHVEGARGAWFELEWLHTYPTADWTPEHEWCEPRVSLPAYRSSVLGSVALYKRVDRAVMRGRQGRVYDTWSDPDHVQAVLGRMKAIRYSRVQFEYSTWNVLGTGLTQYELTA